MCVQSVKRRTVACVQQLLLGAYLARVEPHTVAVVHGLRGGGALALGRDAQVVGLQPVVSGFVCKSTLVILLVHRCRVRTGYRTIRGRTQPVMHVIGMRYVSDFAGAQVHGSNRVENDMRGMPRLLASSLAVMHGYTHICLCMVAHAFVRAVESLRQLVCVFMHQNHDFVEDVSVMP